MGTMPPRHTPQSIARARALRNRQTKAESLLWYVLRNRRLCGLKFRRQFPVEPFIADFACVKARLIVEIDGGYHDYTYADDRSRQRRLEQSGWKVLQFSNEDVLDDVQAVAVAIARHLNREPVFRGKSSP
jgi:adenine-specific DNA-methyltransferase